MLRKLLRGLMMFMLVGCVVTLVPIIILRAQINTDYKTPEELADSDGQFADLGGTRVYYRTQGDPTNPAVMLIHGFGGSTFTWRDTLTPVAEAGYYAIAIDLPPFGLSDKNPTLDYSRSATADLVASLLDELQIEQAIVVGHSMGGAVTAQFAVRHPERVSKLVFVAGGIFEPMPTSDGEAPQNRSSNSPLALLSMIDPTSPFAGELLRTFVTRDFFVNSIKSAYYDSSMVTEEVADGYARLLLIEDAPNGFLAYTLAQEQHPITLAQLVEVATMPTLIIWGAEDTWVNISMGNAMRDRLYDVEMIVYPLVGHLPMEENTQQFNTDLINFLEQ